MKFSYTLWSMVTDGMREGEAINRRYARPRLACLPQSKSRCWCCAFICWCWSACCGYKFATGS